ncbi:MAG: hypothetical protein INR66_17550 [Gordonia polyisoprenivorans]|nr:hypothetical protein [Gordonia polyisoprenivorans]
MAVMSEPMFVCNIDPRTRDMRDEPFAHENLDAFVQRWPGIDVAVSPDTVTFDPTPGPECAETVLDVLTTVGGTALGAHLPTAISCDRAWLGADHPPMTTLVLVRDADEIRDALTMDAVHPGIYDGPRSSLRMVRRWSDEHVATALGGNVFLRIDGEHVHVAGRWFETTPQIFTGGALHDVGGVRTRTARQGASPTELRAGLTYAADGWVMHPELSRLRLVGHGVELIVTGPQKISVRPAH